MSSYTSMSSNADSHLSIQSALEVVRNAEGEVDPTVTDFLVRTVESIWDRIQAEPDDYVLSKDEFALFNFYVNRYRSVDSEATEKAVARFWKNHQVLTD